MYITDLFDDIWLKPLLYPHHKNMIIYTYVTLHKRILYYIYILLRTLITILTKHAQ